MKFPTFAHERKYSKQWSIVIGVDEAGRGPLAGPVVAASVRYRSHKFSFLARDVQYTRLIRDSKKLSKKQRDRAFSWILDHFDIGVGVSDAQEIDQINILQATFVAMRRAIQSCLARDVNKDDVAIMVDGNQKIRAVEYAQYPIVAGDSQSISIAAASIVAKVTRDQLMENFDAQYPVYGFAQHKGYGTKKHLEFLCVYGPSPVHRISFAPVAKVLKNLP